MRRNGRATQTQVQQGAIESFVSTFQRNRPVDFCPIVALLAGTQSTCCPCFSPGFTVDFELAEQSSPGDAQRLGRLALVPPRVFYGLDDHLPLHLVQVAIERHGWAGSIRILQFKICGCDLGSRVLALHYGSENHILDFADIAWPRMV